MKDGLGLCEGVLRAGAAGLAEESAEKVEVEGIQPAGQFVQPRKGVKIFCQALEDIGGVEKVSITARSDLAHHHVAAGAGLHKLFGKDRCLQAREDEALEILKISRIRGGNALRAEFAEVLEDGRFVACGSDHAEPVRQALQATCEHIHNVRTPFILKRLVEGIDQDVADALLRRGEFAKRLQDALQKPSSGIRLAPLFPKGLLHGRDLELGRILGQSAGDHRREALHKSCGPQCFAFVRLAAMVADHLASGIFMNELGDDAGFAGTGIARDQKSALLRLVAPKVDFLEKPFASGEADPLLRHVV